MKPIIILAATMLFSSVSFSQEPYTDSIRAFQKKYVDELYTIIKKDTAYIRFYPVNPSMKVVARVELLVNQKPFKMTTSSGTSKEAEKYAQLTFTLQGREHKLFAYQLLSLKNSQSTAHLFFVPFVDNTSNNESYGGGRYIDFETVDIQNSTLVIDFNKAYNPYCAFVPGYNCPIPPKENTLSIPVKAGERYWKEKFVH